MTLKELVLFAENKHELVVLKIVSWLSLEHEWELSIVIANYARKFEKLALNSVAG